MAYTVKIEKSVIKTLAKLPRADQKRIARRIDSLSKAPRPPGVKKLAAKEDIYRVRAGDYRIIYQVKDKKLLVLIVRLGHRKDIYR